MKRNWFKTMVDHDLQSWWANYGAARQAGYYPGLRRARARCRAELALRGLPAPERAAHTPRPKGYGPEGDQYLRNWGLC